MGEGKSQVSSEVVQLRSALVMSRNALRHAEDHMRDKHSRGCTGIVPETIAHIDALLASAASGDSLPTSGGGE